MRFTCVWWTLLWLDMTWSTFLKFFRFSLFSEFDTKLLGRISQKDIWIFWWILTLTVLLGVKASIQFIQLITIVSPMNSIGETMIKPRYSPQKLNIYFWKANIRWENCDQCCKEQASFCVLTSVRTAVWYSPAATCLTRWDRKDLTSTGMKRSERNTRQDDAKMMSFTLE